jgi:hypothetical protein
VTRVASRALAALALALAILVWPAHSTAQTSPPAAARSAPTISVVTFGPGDETFAKFGHNAILVSDPTQPPGRRELVFNYGTFRFDSPWLVLDFLKGKLSYWLSVSTLERTVAAYRAANRSVSLQELSLTPETARALSAFLHENAKPENAYYRYDYYRDNCSTRVRDVIDAHVGHRLAAASRGPAGLSYREHTRRLTSEAPLLFFGLDLAMGPLIDSQVTQWDEMFLPARVEAKVAELSDDRGAPLVRRQRVLFEAKRTPVSESAPGFDWRWLGIGVVVCALLCALGRVRRRWSDVGVGLSVGALGALTGTLGVLLLVLWLLTDHDVTYWNRNVLLCPPWALALPVLAVDWCRATPRRGRLMMQFVAASVACAVLALLLRLLHLGNQNDDPALSLFVPVWLGAGFAVWERCSRPLPGFWPRKAAGASEGAAPAAPNP